MKFYSHQDVLIGHYRRYELSQLRDLFISRGLEELTYFGVYGQAMRVQLYQAANPDKMESDIMNLRKKYISNPVFRRIYDKFVFLLLRAISNQIHKIFYQKGFGQLFFQFQV